MGLVVMIVLLFLVIAFVMVVLIRRRTSKKVEISGGHLHEYICCLVVSIKSVTILCTHSLETPY